MNSKKSKSLRVQVEYAKAFIIAIIVITIVCPVATKAYFEDIYEISIDGQVVGYTLSEEDVNNAYKDARLKKSKENNSLVIVEMPIDIKSVKGNKMKASTKEEISEVLYTQLDDLMENRKVLAYTIKINDYTATLSTKEDVLNALEETQATYDVEDKFIVEYTNIVDRETGALGIDVAAVSTEVNQTETVSNPEGGQIEDEQTDGQSEEEQSQDEQAGEKTVVTEDGIFNIDFKEDIQIIETYVQPEEIAEVNQVVSDLTTPHDEIDKYEVRPGDCLSVIAQNHDMTLDELVAENEGLDVDSDILIGDELNVIVPKTEISVLVDEQATYNENYYAETEYVDDSSLYVGNDVVVQEATEGERVVTAIISYNNGSEYSREIINQDIITEAQPKIVHRGTKTIPTYMYPLSNPRQTSGFGMRWGKMHKGLDFGCPVGTAVFASRGGTIVRAGWAGAYGYCVDIDHGDGVLTRYGHLSNPLVSVGQYVKQGEKIALSGNTGRSTGPHLHFEIRVGGEPQNPANYLN